MTGVEALFDDASGDLALGDLEAAAAKYRRCTELDPAFVDGWHALAMALMKLGRHPEAVDAARRSAELQPKDPIAWTTLSMCHQRNGQIPEAEAAAAKSRVLSWGEQLRKPPEA